MQSGHLARHGTARFTARPLKHNGSLQAVPKWVMMQLFKIDDTINMRSDEVSNSYDSSRALMRLSKSPDQVHVY
jgi:3'-phosphoadenosine 5'-phosphosulfate sulfotransferase